MQSGHNAPAGVFGDRDPWIDALAEVLPNQHTIHVSDRIVQSNLRLTKAVIYQFAIHGKITQEEADRLVARITELWTA